MVIYTVVGFCFFDKSLVRKIIPWNYAVLVLKGKKLSPYNQQQRKKLFLVIWVKNEWAQKNLI